MLDERIAGLDAIRSVLMLAGLLVHAPTGLGEAALFDAIALISDGFRVGCFFALSGFIGTLAMRRRPLGAWVGDRLIQLGVPALFGMAVLSPLIWLMIAVAPATDQVLPLPFAWHHLWFLFVLMAYTPVAAVLEVAERRWHWSAWVDARSRPDRAFTGVLVLGVTAAASLLGLILMTPLITALVPPSTLSASGNARLAGGYLPLFVLGIVLARCPRLRGAVFRARLASTAIVVAGLAACAIVIAGPAGDMSDYLHVAVGVLCPPTAFALMLELGCGDGSVSPRWRSMAAACYTVYLLHLPIAVAVNLLLASLSWHPHAAFAVAVIVSGGASFLFHDRVVRRTPALALLLNGRWRGRRVRAIMA